MRYLPTGPPRIIFSQTVNKEHRFMLFALLEAVPRVSETYPVDQQSKH
jgi:hypothetical protein